VRNYIFEPCGTLDAITGFMHATELKALTLTELSKRYRSVMGEITSNPTGPRSPEFKALVKELKRRGINSLTTLERRIAEGN
jgi:hypothetical protein